MKIGVKWGSLTGSVSHFYEFSKKLKVKSALYYTQSDSDTGYNFEFLGQKEGISTRNAMDDNDIAYVREVGLTSNWEWLPNQYNRVRFGLSAQYHWYHSGRAFSSLSEEDGVPTSKNSDDVSQGYRAFEPAIYAEDEIFLRYNLTLNAGLRIALFSTPGKTYPSFEPRVAFKWLINNSISAKLSYTRMSQFAHLVSAVYMDLPSNSWMPSTANARPMLSDQVAGGIYTTFGPFKFNLEGWYKTMEHMLVYNGSNTFVPPITEWEKSFTEGRGRSYGMEVEATYSKGPLTLRLLHPVVVAPLLRGHLPRLVSGPPRQSTQNQPHRFLALCQALGGVCQLELPFGQPHHFPLALHRGGRQAPLPVRRTV